MNLIKLVFRWYINTIAISILVFILVAVFNFMVYKLTGVLFSSGAEWVPPTIAAAIISPILSTLIMVKNK